MSRLALVVAKAANNIIGAAGKIPWHIPDDMRHFRDITMGKPCIMGRRTWESLPKRPLPGRPNIVVSHNSDFNAPGAAVELSFGAALARAQAANPSEIAVIGGAEIYRVALPLADTIHLTQIEAEFDGDTYFPGFAHDEWREVARENRATAEGLRFAFVILHRRNGHGKTQN